MGASALFLTGVLLLGFMISALAKSQLAASQFALLTTFLPAFLLSGFAFPIDQMPVAIRVVTYIFPARYYVTALKGVFLKGAGIRGTGRPAPGDGVVCRGGRRGGYRAPSTKPWIEECARCSPGSGKWWSRNSSR